VLLIFNEAVISKINRQKSTTMNTFWKTGWKSLSLIRAVLMSYFYLPVKLPHPGKSKKMLKTLQ
jgi:hypothetical protein